jgi:anthranilate synthase/aminodeoxychorismate synthase-like glutamine amidotransferase
LILLVDNFDSFTYNLQNLLVMRGQEVVTVRYDALAVRQVYELPLTGLAISPGPGHPRQYPAHKELIAHYEGKIPILGICLGHQSICHYYGARVRQATRPMHGKTSLLRHGGHAMFRQVPNPFTATRYHSLVVDQLPKSLEETACSQQGEIMSVSHVAYPIWGHQFHPEAYLTTNGPQLVLNWLDTTLERSFAATHTPQTLCAID